MKPIRGGLLSAVGVVLLLLAACPAVSWAAYPGENGLIAYAGQKRESWTGAADEIFTIPPKGGDPTQLTDNFVADEEPSWSANGRKIVFVRWGADTGGVWTMKADGHHQHLVAPLKPRERWYAWPDFSPGGGRIVMVTHHAISKVGTDGSHLRPLVSGWLGGPNFSPGGKRIVFSGRPNDFHDPGIWTVRRDGSHLRRVTRASTVEDEYDANPDWRPDGRRIAYVHCATGSDRGCLESYVYSVRPDGSGKQLLFQYSEGPFAYAPAGNWMAFGHSRIRGGYWDSIYVCADIVRIRPTGDPRRHVTENCPEFDNGGVGGFARSPSWQPIPPA